MESELAIETVALLKPEKVVGWNVIVKSWSVFTAKGFVKLEVTKKSAVSPVSVIEDTVKGAVPPSLPILKVLVCCVVLMVCCANKVLFNEDVDKLPLAIVGLLPINPLTLIFGPGVKPEPVKFTIQVPSSKSLLLIVNSPVNVPSDNGAKRTVTVWEFPGVTTNDVGGETIENRQWY